MSTLCHPLPRSVAEEMLQVAAQAMCNRPNDTAAQRDSRTRQMVLTVLGGEPRDGVEYVLLTLVFGHFQMILDAMADIFRGETHEMKAKSRASVVSLDRALLAMMKEMRLQRVRPADQPIERPRQSEAEAAPKSAATTPDPTPEPAGNAETSPPPAAAVEAAQQETRSPQVTLPEDVPHPLAAGLMRQLAALIDPGAPEIPISDGGTFEDQVAVLQAAFVNRMETQKVRANDAAAVATAHGD